MRKSRIIILIACLLAAVMLLSSCGSAVGTIKFKKIADGELYKDIDPAYAAAVEVSELKDATQQSSNGDLLLFSTEVESEGANYTKYLVYNLAENKVVYTITESDVLQATIRLESTPAHDVGYFVVTTTTYAKTDGVVDYADFTEKTILCADDGREIAAANYNAQVEENYSLLRFDGKVYHVSEDGNIEYALDLSPLAAIPDITAETEKYYYATDSNNRTLIVLDKELQVVSTHVLPSYMDTMTASIVLEDNKVMMQYLVQADPYTEEYDLYVEENGAYVKYDLYTILVNGKNGKVDEVDLEYVFEDCETLDAEERAVFGLKEKYSSVAWVMPIENKRINENMTQFAIISDSGKVQLLKQINGLDVRYAYLVATNRWMVMTNQAYVYLVDEKANVLGEISNVNDGNTKYLVADGKVYGLDLSVKLDYRAEELTIKEILDDAILFESKDGELIAFADDAKTTLIAKDAAREYVDSMSSTYRGYFVIADRTDPAAIKYEVYNAAAKKILTLDYNATSFGIYFVTSNYEGEALLRVTGWDATNLKTTYTYYRLG